MRLGERGGTTNKHSGAACMSARTPPPLLPTVRLQGYASAAAPGGGSGNRAPLARPRSNRKIPGELHSARFVSYAKRAMPVSVSLWPAIIWRARAWR
jgi:hypothetical protein